MTNKLVYAKKLNGAQRKLLERYAGVTGWEPIGQDDLDLGNITFAELWQKNVQILYDTYCDVINFDTDGTGAI